MVAVAKGSEIGRAVASAFLNAASSSRSIIQGMASDDWRLRGQDKYLLGSVLATAIGLNPSDACARVQAAVAARK